MNNNELSIKFGVPFLDTCQNEFFIKGFREESRFVWGCLGGGFNVFTKHYSLYLIEVWNLTISKPAPQADEILKVLPKRIEYKGDVLHLTLFEDKHVHYRNQSFSRFFVEIENGHLAEAYANVLIAIEAEKQNNESEYHFIY